MSWSNAYVGIPYANMGRSALGCDCWGLARLVYDAAFDVLLFRHGRFESHVGIYVHQGVMLHMATDDQSKHERFDQGRWKARLAGYFRHSNVRLKGAL
mgnify:CR=1 FL=1